MYFFHDFNVTIHTYKERGKENDFPIVNECPGCGAKKLLHRHGFYERNVISMEDKEEVRIIPANFVTFAEEANGNITMYHKGKGDVLMYAHDHCFDHIEPLQGYPEYTLYKIKNCEKYSNWVETVARQWLEHIE